MYDGKGDISNFFRDFDDIVAEIRSSGGKIGKMEDVEAVVHLLAALPSDYSPIIASFGEINENALVTLESVKGSLLDYDLKRKDERKVKKVEIEPGGAAYFSDSAKAEKVKCSYCGRQVIEKSNVLRKELSGKTATKNLEVKLTSPRTNLFLGLCRFWPKLASLRLWTQLQLLG